MTCKWVSSSGIRCLEEANDTEKHCIFHKNNKTCDENDKFYRLIKENKITNFVGFVFEEKFVAKDILNYKYDTLDFSFAVFKKEADFSQVEFEGKLTFYKTIFEDSIYFVGSSFLEEVEFDSVRFNKEYINHKPFENLKVKSQKTIINNSQNVPRLDGIIFKKFTKFILRDAEYKKGEYLVGKINYRIARKQAQSIGDYENIGYYYYNERNYGSKILHKSQYPTYGEYLVSKFFDRLSKYTIGYGEKPWYILYVSLIIISLFALLYMFVGITTLDNVKIGVNINQLFEYSLKELFIIYIDLWYFSMVTFSTVGYGDLVVSSVLGKLLVSVEVFFGVTIGSTWASVIIKRMIR